MGRIPSYAPIATRQQITPSLEIVATNEKKNITHQHQHHHQHHQQTDIGQRFLSSHKYIV